jgi:hypothetical protein
MFYRQFDGRRKLASVYRFACYPVLNTVVVVVCFCCLRFCRKQSSIFFHFQSEIRINKRKIKIKEKTEFKKIEVLSVKCVKAVKG